MSFKDRDFAQRFTAMGDEAERVFEEVTENNFVRYGLNRPPIRLSNVPEFVRYTPDYLQHDRLVEVQGVGRDQMIKLKVDKYMALMQWNQHTPTFLFVWDSKNKRHTEIPIDGFPIALCALEQFSEGKPYFELKAEDVPYPWVERNA